MLVSFEESSIVVDENAGTYMACVVKNGDTIAPVTVEIFDANTGSAQRDLGMCDRRKLICDLSCSLHEV